MSIRVVKETLMQMPVFILLSGALEGVTFIGVAILPSVETAVAPKFPPLMSFPSTRLKFVLSKSSTDVLETSFAISIFRLRNNTRANSNNAVIKKTSDIAR